MSRNKSDDIKYLVLSVREGFGFGCLKNLLLRISPVFEDHRLISDYIVGVSEPKFNLYFIWRTTNSHLKRLQKRCSNIQIDIWATKSDQTWTAGYALIGAQHAEIVTPNDSISYRRLRIQNVKAQFGMLPPELFVTLNVQCNPFVAVSASIYLANLTDVLNPKYCSSGQIRIASNVATATKKTIKIQKSYDHPPPPKQKNSDLRSSIDPNQKQSNKETPRRTAPKLNDKKVESSKPAKPNTNPSAKPNTDSSVKPNTDSSAKPNTEPSAKPNADSATLPNEDQQVVSVPFHQYQLEMQCSSVEWYATPTNVKVSLRFGNPTNNSVATAIENEDFNLLNDFIPQIICRMYYISIPNNLLKTVLCHPPLLLISKAYTNQVITVGGVNVKYMKADPKSSDCSIKSVAELPSVTFATAIENEDFNLLNDFIPQIICRMYYISIPNNLLKTVLCHPPLLLISKAYTNQVITVGGVNVKYMKADPKMEHFQSDIALTTKEKKIVGHTSVMITFQDLGVISLLTDLHHTKCISKFQQRDKAEIEDLGKDFARLLQIHKELKATYSKIEAEFQKLTDNPIPYHNLSYRQLLKPKSDNYIKVIDIDKFVDAVKQESAAQESKDVQKRVSFYVFPKCGETTEKASAAQCKSLKGILKETTNRNSETLEKAHLRKTVPDNIDQPCCSKSLKETGLPYEVTFTNKDYSSNRHQLQVQETSQEQTNKGYRLIKPLDVLKSTNKEITENYPGKHKSNYHVLTQSLLHTQRVNAQLEIEYLNAVKELEYFKENIPYMEMRRYTEIQNLKYQINKFRPVRGLTIKIVEDEDQKGNSVQKDKKAESTARKNPCEACKVLSKVPKDTKSNQSQSIKGSSSSKGKKKKSYQPRM